MNKVQVAERLVDMMLDGDYNSLKKVEQVADQFLDKVAEATDNEIPEEPDEGKTPGKAIKKELEEHEDNIVPEVPAPATSAGAAIKKEITNDKTSVKTNKNPIDNTIPQEPDEGKTPGKAIKKDIEEHVDNIVPEEPDEGKTPGKAIKKAITDPQSSIKPGKPPIKNVLADIPGEVSSAKGKIKKSIDGGASGSATFTEASEIDGGKYKDYFDDLRKKGMNDEAKLKGMLNKAKAIAAKQGNEGDEEAIIGIMQGFLGGK